MTRWKTAFESQQANGRVQNALALMQSIKTEGLVTDAIEEYDRLVKVLKVLEARFSNFDPDLLPLNTFGNFGSWLSNLVTNIQSFSRDKNIQNLRNANTNADQVLEALRPVSTALAVEEFKSLAEANGIAQQKIVEEVDRVKARGLEVKAQLDLLSNAVNDGKARLAENDQTLQQQKARLDQSIAEYQKQFSEAQEKRSKESAELAKRIDEEFTTRYKSFEEAWAQAEGHRKEEYDRFFAQAKIANDAQLKFLKQREEEVNKIFGTIGATAFAGNYKTSADSEAKAANIWRRIALGLMGAMILVGGYAFYYSIGHETDWRVFGFRLGTLLVLAVPAVYAANESSKHREREKFNRKIHLELASIDAYLVLLPEDERNKIKGALAEKFFGTPVAPEKSGDLDQKDLFGLISTVVNNLTKGK